MPVGICLYRALGAGLAILIMEVLASIIAEPLSRVPFVTSIVLVMALPGSPPAQPKALIGGHLISCAVGYLVATVAGPNELSGSIAVALATAGMMMAGVMHPPAGLDAFLIPVHGLSARWIAMPVLTGVLLLAGFARLWSMGELHLFHGDRPYFWPRANGRS